MSQLEEVRAVTWDGTASFPMLGLYGRDSSGRFVLTREGRYQIPDDAIVLRSPATTQEAEVQKAPTVEVAPAEVEPAEEPPTQKPSTPAKASHRRKR